MVSCSRKSTNDKEAILTELRSRYVKADKSPMESGKVPKSSFCSASVRRSGSEKNEFYRERHCSAKATYIIQFQLSQGSSETHLERKRAPKFILT